MVRYIVDDGALIVSLDGELDHHFASTAKEAIDREYSRCGARDIVFDFSRVGFMDSSGIGMIIGRYKQVSKRGGFVYAKGMNDGLFRIFEISGLHKIVRVR